MFSAGVVSVSSAALAASAMSNASATCAGDCDNSGAVTVEELVRGVSIALGTLPLDQCQRFDCHATGQVTIDCLINAVSAALNGCQSTPTRSPTQNGGTASPTDTPAAASTPSATRSGTLVPPPTATSTRAPTATNTPMVTLTATAVQTPPVSINLSVSGMAVIKVRTGAQGVTLMVETLTALSESGPERSITLLDDDGAVSGRYSAPSGWALIDFAQHPSGEISAVLATARTVRLVRLDRTGIVRNDFALTDAQAPNDPFYDHGGVRDDGSLLPVLTRDAVRLAAIGENLAVALRTGRNAVVAYRFDYTQATSYTRIWRTLVEPGVTMFAIGITSGSFDVFGALENHWHVHLDADAAGNVAVAVVGRAFISPLFAAHADYFNEPTDVATGLLVTRLAPDGQRLGSTVIDTVQTSELHGLRLSRDDISLVGRVFSERRGDGTGWNAYAAHVDRTSGALLSYGVIDIDRGEVLFDIVRLAQGRFLVAGAAGYSQNPGGGSISEQTMPLLAVLESDGMLKQRIDVVAGARQNQLRSLAQRNGNWLVGGMVNGPGTHSGDGNPAAIVADGFVHETTISVP